ncbi:hypothetical protein [Actinomadura litoris]|uniref:hypothetical protein n=1 Tax=Actinomadura litoris TaxID=2678616 RepID=UPI001FA7CFBE|nr:hypothetical protein [Actinomadura litoris]
MASFTTLRHLGGYTGWGRLDWLLPATLDTFVITTTRVWQSKRTRSAKVRRFAACNAIGAIVLSLAGNAVYHAIKSGAWAPGRYLWLLVVLVSSIPPIAIGLISHLAVLRSRDGEFAAAEQARRPDPAPTRPDLAARPLAGAPDSSASRGPDPTGSDSAKAESASPDSDEPAPSETAPARPDPTRTEPKESSKRRPASTPVGMGEDDPLRDEALAYATEHFERTGRKIGAEPLAVHFGIGTRRSRLLRDAVHGIHEVESGGGS